MLHKKTKEMIHTLVPELFAPANMTARQSQTIESV